MTNQASPNAIFVYGTLKRGQVREPCWPFTPLRIVPATVRGRLFDLGPYPAMIAGEGVVHGEVWQFEGDKVAATLAILDEIEGYRGAGSDNLYERVIVEVDDKNASGEGRISEAYSYQMAPQRLPASARVLPSPANWSPVGNEIHRRHQMADPFLDF